MGMLTIKPAYGRIYGNSTQLVEDWKRGKDFSSDLGYCSVRDIQNMYYEYGITVLKACMDQTGNHFCLMFINDKEFE